MPTQVHAQMQIKRIGMHTDSVHTEIHPHIHTLPTARNCSRWQRKQQLYIVKESGGNNEHTEQMTAVSKRMKVEQARNGGGHGAEMNNGGNKQGLSLRKSRQKLACRDYNLKNIFYIFTFICNQTIT